MILRRRVVHGIASAAVGAACVLSPPAQAARADVDRPFALIGALDKITARTTTLGIAIGDTVTFDRMDVTARACRSTPPEETPENAAFLEVTYHPSERPPEQVFSGWMFSSSPAISAMEHPIYDVWVISCEDEMPQPPEDMGHDPEDLPLPQADLIPAPTPERRR